MRREYRFVADLGPLWVAIVTDHPGLSDYLRDFYPLRAHPERDSAPTWTIEARLAAPPAGMWLTPWRVGYRGDRKACQAVICSTNTRNLAITVRKAVREVLLDYCEARQYTMLHASAVANDQYVIIVVGDKGSGKTTLALNGALTAGYRYLSNDHLVLYRDDAGLVATSLPTPIPIKIGTYLDYAHRLGEPWENEGVDIDEFRQMSLRQRYSHDCRLLYTYRSLRQVNPLHTALRGHRVIVVLASYASDGQHVSMPTPVESPVTALWPHVRFDWVFDSSLNTHYLPRAERDRDAFARDAAERLAELATTSHVVGWRHHGALAPLLAQLADRPGGQR